MSLADDFRAAMGHLGSKARRQMLHGSWDRPYDLLLAEHLVHQVLAVLLDRSGFAAWWSGLKYKVRVETAAEMIEAVLEQLHRTAPEFEEPPSPHRVTRWVTCPTCNGNLHVGEYCEYCAGRGGRITGDGMLEDCGYCGRSNCPRCYGMGIVEEGT